MVNNKIDWATVLVRSFDHSNNSLKTTPSDATTFLIELDANEGDSVQTQKKQLTASATGLTDSATGVVLSSQSTSGMDSIRVFCKTDVEVSGTSVLTLEVSPVDSGDVWVATAATATIGASAGTVVMTDPFTNACSRRARVSIDNAVSGGSFDVFMVGNG